MKTAGSQSFAVLLVLSSALSVACVPVTIEPPSPAKQTLLVLPAETALEAQHRFYGFSYAYEIASVDNSVPPYQAIFKLPIKNDMVIVDSLPPGNYRISKFLTIPVGTGTKTYNSLSDSTDIRLRLEAGKVTIAPVSLYVRTYNEIPGRGMSTTYQRRINRTTEKQKRELLARLEQEPGFAAWEVLGATQSRAASAGARADLATYEADTALRGEWSGFWRATSAAAVGDCAEGKLKFDLDISRLQGEGVDGEGNRYRLTASLVGNGLVRGKLSLERARVAKVSGKLYDDGSILGSFERTDGCQFEWKAQKN